jgi:hypothetical protein
MDRKLGLLLLLGVGLAAVLVGSALGWFGGVQVCGADRVPGCVSWPTPVAALVWAAFVLGVAALVVWQVRYLDR